MRQCSPKRPKFSMAPSARAFGAGLRPWPSAWPSATIRPPLAITCATSGTRARLMSGWLRA
eukprot:scaffold10769_cov49-Phaeocystis_antarctica.AAC.3